MINLSKRWPRKSGGDDDDKLSLPMRDDFQPLHSNEQEEMVQSFERKHAQQNFLWRLVFALLIMGFALFLVYAMINQAMYPWELRFHAYFMDETESWTIILAECVAVLVCLMAVKGFTHSDQKSGKQWLWCSCFAGFLAGLFWLYHMLRLPWFRWDVIWLPLAPSGELSLNSNRDKAPIFEAKAKYLQRKSIHICPQRNKRRLARADIANHTGNSNRVGVRYAHAVQLLPYDPAGLKLLQSKLWVFMDPPNAHHPIKDLCFVWEAAL